MKKPPLPFKDDSPHAPEEDPKFNLFRDVVLVLLILMIILIVSNMKK